MRKLLSPNKIFLAGKDQYKVFLKLGWKKKELNLCESLRFFKTNKSFDKKIFFPINFKSEKNALENIKFLIKNFDISDYKIQLHPASSKEDKNILIQKKKRNYLIQFLLDLLVPL